MIDEIVKYCHEKFQNRGNICANCTNLICFNSNCEQCLKDIHFDPNCHRSYDCPNMCYYYVCQNIYKYATEMAWIWHDFITQNAGEGKPFQQLEICSIGCGPCSELIALDEYCSHKNLTLPYNFVGFDIENTWNEIQNAVRSFSKNPDSISFKHSDVFNYYKSFSKPNVIILNYVLSSIVKHTPNYIETFVNSLDTLFQDINPCAIFINDINHVNARKFFYEIQEKTISKNKGGSIQQFHFKNTYSKFIPYGDCRGSSKLWRNPTKTIQDNYNSNSECHSAQLIIIKK